MGQQHAHEAAPTLAVPTNNAELLILFETEVLHYALSSNERRVYEALCNYYLEEHDVECMFDSTEAMGTLGIFFDRVNELRRDPRAPDKLRLKNKFLRAIFHVLTTMYNPHGSRRHTV